MFEKLFSDGIIYPVGGTCKVDALIAHIFAHYVKSK
jgi:hypothetical protein